MTDTAPIEDRAENIKYRVERIIDDGHDNIYAKLDQLHAKGIHDNDVVEALRALHESDLLEGYAEWADIDIREDDNTTTNPVVPDPADSPSYADHPLNKPVIVVPNPTVISTVEQLDILRDGTILALKNGYAGQVRNDCGGAYLAIAGSDLTIRISDTLDGNREIVDAAERRELAYYLPAVALGVAE